MELPEGFHREIIKAKESRNSIDFTEDSIVKSVDVSPLKSGGSNFKTHALVEKSSSRIIYRPSIGGALFVLVFIAIGMGFVIYNLVSESGQFSDPSLLNFLGLTFGLMFAFVGAYMMFHLFKPRVFDKQLGFYHKSYKFKPETRYLTNQFELNRIIAIQIIGETITDEDGSYGSFELNLVLEDGTRRNVVDHGNLKSIIDDAHVISDFLNVPIWHAKSGK
ncbi:hypothetical protein [Winogradskyella sp.]|uniref:hypothetical protein n=1 Tax=Winogradskyella sp. TaxID=1883156 RepID=UPI00261F58D3|nr:hypothetical protein [Winogradskyella sp.]